VTYKSHNIKIANFSSLVKNELKVTILLAIGRAVVDSKSEATKLPKNDTKTRAGPCEVPERHTKNVLQAGKRKV